MTKEHSRLGALLCTAAIILQMIVVPVSAYNVDEFVSAPPSNWTMIADSAVADGETGGWKSSASEIIKNGAEYKLSGEVALDSPKNTATGYTDSLVLAIKYKLEDENAYFTIEGKHKTMIDEISHDTALAPIFINISRTAISQSNVSATNELTINEAISDNGTEHTLTAVFYTKNNSIQIWRDGKYVGVFSYRTPYGESLINLRLRGRTGNVTFTDAKLYSVGEGPVEVGDSLILDTFETATLDSVWTISGESEVITGETNGEYLLQLTENGAEDSQAYFTLPQELSEGIFNICYDVRLSSTASSPQFYLTGNAGHRITSNIKKGGVSLTVGSDSEVKEFLTENTLSANKWYTFKYRVDLAEKTHTLEVYNTEDMSLVGKSSLEALRNFTSISSLTKGFFRIARGNGATAYQIDNFRFEKDITNYGYLQIIPTLNSGLTVNGAENIIEGVSGLTVGELKNKLYCHTPNTIVITDALNNVLPDSSDVAGGYVVVKNAIESRAYGIKTEASISLLGAEVAGKEWTEAETILLPGTATLRVLATNNADSAKTFKLRAIVGNGTPVESSAIEVGAGNTELIKLEDVVIPDNTSDGNLKLELVGNDIVQYSFNKKISTGTEVSIPSVFADGMVLQRGEKTNIFGMAPTGAQIEVNFDGQTKAGVAANGEFLVQLENLTASNSGKTLTVDITVRGDTETFTYNNVVVGDVFYGGGQSNMGITLDNQKSVSDYATYQKATVEAVKEDFETRENWENLRCFVLPNRDSMDDNALASWTIGSVDNYYKMPSTMYAFVDALRSFDVIDSDVPIGIVRCSIGGTSIGSWIDADILETYKDRATSIYSKYLSGTPLTNSNAYHATDLYYAMAEYVLPYTVKAAVWYQGEQDAVQPTDAWYDEMATDMIDLMRTKWGYDVPYFVVQLPGFEKTDWTNMRLVQWEIRNEADDIYVVVTNDTGETEGSNSIHPVDKRALGDRLAREYAYHIAGDTTMPHQGPVYKSSWIDDGKVYVLFDNVNDGLHGGFISQAQDGSYPGFSLSADDTAWTAADVEVDGNALVLSATGLENPAYVSFAFDGLGRLGTANFPILGAGTKSTYEVEGVSKTSVLPVAPFKELIGNEEGAITHTISFANGAADATGTIPSALYKKANDTITLPQNPFIRQGYEFVGWNDGTSDYLAGASYFMPDRDVAFTAVWEENASATGTYVDGSALYIDSSGINVEYPIRTLLAFYSNNSGDTAPSNPMDVVIFEQSLTQIESSYDFNPIAEPKDYMIVLYEGRNGQQVKEVIQLPHVTHWYNDWSHDEAGHWHKCANASCGYSTTKESHGDFEADATDCTANTLCGICGYGAGAANQEHLFADALDGECNREGCLHTRSAAAVNISFNVNGGMAVSPTNVTTDSSGMITVNLPVPTRNGWRFDGWYTSSTGGTKIVKNSTVFYETSTVYAHWTSVYQQGSGGSSGGGGAAVTPVTYKLHFETNGGTGVNDLSRQKGIEINVNGFVPVKEGFEFAGWYTDEELKNSVSSIVLAENITVYAKWEAIEDEQDTEPEPSKTAFTDVSEDDWFESSVAFVLENGIMNGVSETEFAPHNTTTRAMLVTMLYRLEGEPETLSQNEFSDVLKDSYYEKAVIWAKENGIVNGYENGSFGTEDAVTREQLASILYRYAEHKGYDANYEDTNILSFNDAFDISEYAYPALQWACKNGIINGDGNNLMPKASAERCQVAAIFARFCELNK